MDQLEPRVRAIELSVATLTEKSTTFATKEDLAKLETTFERSLKEQSRWTAIAIIGGMSLLSAIVFGIARYLAAAPPV